MTPPDQAPKRIHILGGSGSGKTTLGVRLAEILGIPVHHLDDLARGGQEDPLVQPNPARERAIADIVTTEAWVTEGIHLGWTDPLLAQSQRIVWLDHIPPSVASRRIVGRFLRQSFAEARSRRGRDRYFRFRDYRQNLRALIAHVGKVRASGDEKLSTVEPGQSRAATAAALAPYWDKVTRCVEPDDVEAFVRQITAAVVKATPSASDAAGITAGPSFER